jgi:Family of unknown function (DUF5678)
MILSGGRLVAEPEGCPDGHHPTGKDHAMAVLDQASLAPKEDLRPYAGKWVALRDGYVVASADDSVSLRDDATVKESDQLLPVPAADSGMYVL